MKLGTKCLNCGGTLYKNYPTADNGWTWAHASTGTPVCYTVYANPELP